MFTDWEYSVSVRTALCLRVRAGSTPAIPAKMNDSGHHTLRKGFERRLILGTLRFRAIPIKIDYKQPVIHFSLDTVSQLN